MGDTKLEELLAANPPKPRTTVKRFALDLKARIASAAAAFRRGHKANPGIGAAAFAPGIEYVLGIVDAALSDYDVRDPEDFAGRTPSAVPPSEPTACRRCSECQGMPHHWMDNDEAEEPGDPTHMCKHCDALGDECETCGGYGEGGPPGSCGGGCETCPPFTECPACKGIGVNERGRTPASTGKAGEG